jgi:ribosomal protein S27E
MGLPAHQDHKARSNSAAVYVRHRPETTLLYQIIQEYWPEFQAELASHGKHLPAYVIKEFDEYLKCGRLEYGFLRVRCASCHDEKLVAFSCKKRGFCPSCGARRMADSAALLVDEVLPHQSMRQWVLSVPFPLRFLFASNPKVMTSVLGIVDRSIATHLTHKAGPLHKLVQ